jgi:serine/threonine-protein kinase ATR
VSSNPDSNALPCIVDGNDNTQWQSDACFPTGYTGRPSMNPLMLLCNGSSPLGSPASFCTASSGSKNLGQATDLSVYTGATVVADPVRTAAGVPDGAAFFAATVPGGPRAVKRVSFKGFSSYNVTVLLVVQPLGQPMQRIPVAVLVPAINNYAWVAVTGQWQVRIHRKTESYLIL